MTVHHVALWMVGNWRQGVEAALGSLQSLAKSTHREMAKVGMSRAKVGIPRAGLKEKIGSLAVIGSYWQLITGGKGGII